MEKTAQNKKFLAISIILIIAAIVIMILTRVYYNASGSIPKGSNVTGVSVPSQFSCVADITYGDMDAKVSITKSQSNTYNLKFSSPDSLNGLELTSQGGNATVNYKGLEFEIDKSKFSSNAIVTSLISVFKSAENVSTLTVTDTTKKVIVASGSTDSGDFSVTVDRKTGNPTKLEIPSISLTAVFSDFTVPEHT